MPGFIKYQLEDWVDPSDDLNDFLNDALECRCVPYLCNIVQLKAKRQGLSELAVRWEHYRLHPQELTLAQLLQACAALGLKLSVVAAVGTDATQVAG